MTERNPLPPGSTIGMLGGGQLGRMFAFEAKRMGYRVICLDPTPNSACGQVCDAQLQADYDDLAAVRRLGEQCAVITYEFENVSVAATELLRQMGKPVYPNPDILLTTKNRLREKEFVRGLGIGVAEFTAVRSAGDVEAALQRIGLPAVLKTTTGGYDGKGQVVIHTADGARQAQQTLGGELIWEKLVPFVCEISVIAARGQDGQVATYPAIENIHVENMLHTSLAPARVSADVQNRAQAIAGEILAAFNYVGTCGVEMFVLQDEAGHESVLVNEIAPRPHNSGHLTLDAAVVSQFEQQVRAVCGLPLGETTLRSPAVMINIIGTGKGNTLLGLENLTAYPDTHFHLYGKGQAKAKRKMGHLTTLAETLDEAHSLAVAAGGVLGWG
jgi:5-(carboxyamino)imidazole ribonucleotide synthase